MSAAPLPPESTQSARTERSFTADAADAPARALVSERLSAQSTDIASRWARQVRGVAQLGNQADAASVLAARVVRALAELLATEAALEEHAELPEHGEHGEHREHGSAQSSDGSMLVELGIAQGSLAFDHGVSLHQVLRAADLLVAMVLYESETALAVLPPDGQTVGAGLRLARRIQQTMSVFTLSLAKGYTHASADGMRDRFRSLRHDLRNPLGTIKNVLALMGDETMPPDARSNPRFHAMADRNTRVLESLITARLSDIAAEIRSSSASAVSVRTVACSVRRDLRGESSARGVAIAVGSDLPWVGLDAGALELLLHAVLRAVLPDTHVGEELGVDFELEKGDDGAVRLARTRVQLETDPPRALVQDEAMQQRLTVLAGQMGARISFGHHVAIAMPALLVPDALGGGGVGGDGDAGDDVGGAGE